MRKQSILAVCACLVVYVTPLAAQIRLPQPVGYINDFAHVIPDSLKPQIQEIIDEVRAKSGGEIVVVTMPSLDGHSADDVALEIGRQWKIGQKGQPGDPNRNTGAVVLVVPKESSPDGRGHLKIELGTNTNTFITAADAGRIRDDFMVPAFQQRDYGRGILLGVAAVALHYADHFGFTLTGDAPRTVQRREDGPHIP
ncbi:MAG TPA: TPM domain-containing protein, partial [Longimicrobiales bacterium]|nr:TPM domain-containing protein [Longimicrobiales bacterium]